MKPVRVVISRSGYSIGRMEFRTAVELKVELRRRQTREARLWPAPDAPYRKVAAAVRVFQRLGISLGIVGFVADTER